MKELSASETTIPSIQITDEAKQQIDLILKNDFTIKDKFLRITISGKGCDGFDYSIGFDSQNPNDIHTQVKNINIILDPFANFYLQKFKIDYIQNLEEDIEGFQIINTSQKEFKGKFWKKDLSKVPSKKFLTLISLNRLIYSFFSLLIIFHSHTM